MQSQPEQQEQNQSEQNGVIEILKAGAKTFARAAAEKTLNDLQSSYNTLEPTQEQLNGKGLNQDQYNQAKESFNAIQEGLGKINPTEEQLNGIVEGLKDTYEALKKSYEKIAADKKGVVLEINLSPNQEEVIGFINENKEFDEGKIENLQKVALTAEQLTAIGLPQAAQTANMTYAAACEKIQEIQGKLDAIEFTENQIKEIKIGEGEGIALTMAQYQMHNKVKALGEFEPTKEQRMSAFVDGIMQALQEKLSSHKLSNDDENETKQKAAVTRMCERMLKFCEKDPEGGLKFDEQKFTTALKNDSVLQDILGTILAVFGFETEHRAAKKINSFADKITIEQAQQQSQQDIE